MPADQPSHQRHRPEETVDRDLTLYVETLEELKGLVRGAQVRTRQTVNTDLLRLYWRIGRTILDRQASEGWGAKVIARLASDLRAEFPAMTGLSRSNLHYMRAFAAAFPEIAIVQQPAGQLPWGHHLVLLDRLDDYPTRVWYAAQAALNGWSRAVLSAQIASNAHQRLGAAPSNFADRLPVGDLAQQMVKDPYVFEFLDIAEQTAERDLEDQLVSHLKSTLLELGRGFAFVGRQYRFEIADDDFAIDLLLFNWLHNRFVVVELKVSKFQPEHTGQLNLYVQWVDTQLRQPHHAATIGLLLCADRNDEVVKLALAGTSAPMAVADWHQLPTDLRTTPEIEAIATAIDQSAPIRHILHDYFRQRRPVELQARPGDPITAEDPESSTEPRP